MKENTSDNQSFGSQMLDRCGEKISWYKNFKEYSGFKERENISNSANYMISANEYRRIPRISNRSINYEFINASLSLDDMRYRSSAEHYDLQKEELVKCQIQKF